MLSKTLFLILTISVKLLLSLVLLVLLIAAFCYAQTTVFRFPVIPVFSGGQIYNPYQNWGGNTINSNFHAHTKAYGGVTDGQDGLQELKEYYYSQGIGSPGISNYFSCTDSEPIRIYEHGMSVHKAHKLAINPDREVYFDYPFYQNTSQKQDIVNRIRKQNGLVVIAHPNMRKGHTEEDMQKIVGYHFTEIRSYHANAQKEWDAALASGKLSWLMANDDAHGIKKQPPGKFYNVVMADSVGGILESMLAGKHYGAEKFKDTVDIALQHIQVANDTVFFDFGANTKYTVAILDGVKKDTIQGGIGSYVFPKESGYVRFVAESDQAKLFTNPLVRNDGKGLSYAHKYSAERDLMQTVLIRILFWTCFALALYTLYRIWSRRPKLRS